MFPAHSIYGESIRYLQPPAVRTSEFVLSEPSPEVVYSRVATQKGPRMKSQHLRLSNSSWCDIH